MEVLGKETRVASHTLQSASTDQKNLALKTIHDYLSRNKASILAANQQDLEVSIDWIQ